MLNNFKKFRRQSGDTIVEVLIATAILSSVLAGAYLTSNRAFTTERDAQEHNQALTIAQAQVEYLYAGGILVGKTCFDPSTGVPASGYCFVDSNTGKTLYTDPTGPDLQCPPTVPASVGYCYQIVDKEVLPLITISSNPLVQSPTYSVQVTWPALGGGTDSVTLNYRPK